MLAPEEAVWWGLEQLVDEEWCRCTLKSGRKGPAVKFWPLDQLSWSMLSNSWGAGTYRCAWFSNNKRKRRATSRPFQVPEASEPGAETGKVAPPSEPDPPSEPTAVAPSSPETGAPKVPWDDKAAAVLAASNLKGSLLAQVLQGTHADDSDLGRTLTILERLAAIYAGMEARMFSQVKADAELRVLRAENEAGRIKTEETARYKAQLTESRQNYDLMMTLTNRLHSAQLDTKDVAAAAELAQLRTQVEQMTQIMAAAQEQAADLAEGNQDGEAEGVVESLARDLGPDVIRGLMDVLGKAARGAGSNGAAMIPSTPGGGTATAEEILVAAATADN